MDIDEDLCEVCGVETARTLLSDFDVVHQNCHLRCGEFKISGTAYSMMRKLDGKKRAFLSGWVRNQNSLGVVPTIDSDNLESILSTPLPPVMDRARMLLVEAEKGLTRLGERFNVNEPRFLAATYSSDAYDVSYLLHVLEEQSFAESNSMGGYCVILPKGYAELDDLRGENLDSSIGFVAMSFGPELKDAYLNGFHAGIEGAGFEPLRIDQVEHINRIDDEIIRQINSSRFMVADFTGHRGGVYFEAGYALGLGLPVFWTCAKKDMDSLHFDIRQFNCIAWESPNELAERLAVRLEAVLGRGPKSKGRPS